MNGLHAFIKKNRGFIFGVPFPDGISTPLALWLWYALQLYLSKTEKVWTIGLNVEGEGLFEFYAIGREGTREQGLIGSQKRNIT